MADVKPELFHWRPVSHSAKVLICLHEAGVDYKSHFVDLLGFDQFSEEFLALNPMGQVPVLRVGDVALAESSLINEYIAEAWPDAGLAPADALGWYECLAWSKYIDYNLSSSVATLGCRKELVPMLAERNADDVAHAIDAIPVEERKAGWREAAANGYSDDVIANSERKIRLVIGRVEARLVDAEWMVGDAYSIADIDTFAMLNTAADIAPGLFEGVGSARTREWLAGIAARPAVKEALAVNADTKGFAPGPEHSRWG
jgi:glutathione S-transferase